MQLRKIISVAVAAASIALIPAGAAMADAGDGDPTACSTYEICFARNSDSLRYYREFYNGDGDHGNNRWYDRHNKTYVNYYLEDDVNRIRNRDGSCDVKVIDWNGALPSVSHTVGNSPNNATWVTLKDGVRNQNNEHQRVNCA